jgi:hypothetical protein
MMPTPEQRSMIDAFRETARTAQNFECACCGLAKPRKELGALPDYEPTDPMLESRMIAPAVYALCEECLYVPRNIRMQKVTAHLAKNGLFKDAS